MNPNISCAMVTLVTNSVSRYPKVFDREKEVVKYLPASRLIKKVNSNYKMVISEVEKDYYIYNDFIQIRKGTKLPENYYASLSVLELRPVPKLYKLVIDTRSREIKTPAVKVWLYRLTLTFFD